MPRGPRNGFDQLKTMVREAEAAEYIYTNDEKIFAGCAVEFCSQCINANVCR